MIPFTIIRRKYIAGLFVLSDVVAHVRCISIILRIVFSLQLLNDVYFFGSPNLTYGTYRYRQFPEKTPCRCNSKLNDLYRSVKSKHRFEDLNSEIFEFAGVADFEKSVRFCAIEFSQLAVCTNSEAEEIGAGPFLCIRDLLEIDKFIEAHNPRKRNYEVRPDWKLLDLLVVGYFSEKNYHYRTSEYINGS